MDRPAAATAARTVARARLPICASHRRRATSTSSTRAAHRVESRAALTGPHPRTSRSLHVVRDARAEAPRGEETSPSPTAVPRAEGVRDGAWSALDASLVEKSQEDAVVTHARSLPDAAGAVVRAPSSSFHLLGLTTPELKSFATDRGWPAFRGKQLRDHLYGAKPARDIDDLTTLSKSMRAELAAANVAVGRSSVHTIAAAADGTAKLLLRLGDDRVVETVGIPATEGGKNRLTACISSQVGCPMRCTFCATGKGGFARNLAPHEIVDQVMSLEEHFGRRVTNVVFMGMGEPLLNVPNVLRAHEALNAEVGIGARHITISTVGVRGSLEALAQARLQSTLAVSLHAPDQALRERLIPSARAYPLDDLLHDCEQYFVATGRRVTFEYTLLAGVNDAPEQAEALARTLYTKKLASHVNLIPYNPVDEAEQFQRPTRAAVFEFRDVLENMNVPASIRQTRGLEAAAACGQLRNAYQKNPLTA